MIKFGTGGWREIIGDGFTKANIQKIAKALSLKMKHEGVAHTGIVLGYDRRFLSKESMQWAAMVFAAYGIKSCLINRSSPTPLIMYYVMKHDYHYGMMITASHNPAIYNGVKIFTAGGRDADEQQTSDIEEYINGVEDDEVHMKSNSNSLKSGTDSKDYGNTLEMDYEKALKTGLIIEINPLNEYLDNIIANIDMDAIKKLSLRIALDPMYGVSETSLKTILLTARCDVTTIHERHDTLFGGKLPSPSAATLKTLQNYVVDKKLDIGIATDGDADRIGIIDDTGRFLHPNDILVLLYYYLVKYKGWHGAVVRNIATTHMLDKVAKQFGETCYEVPVGFKYISSKMQETNAVIGGESSGGLTVRGHIKGKDGIYAASLLVEMIAITGKKLSALSNDITNEFGAIHMEERDYKFNMEKRNTIFNTLMIDKCLPKIDIEIDKISYLDGCKVYFKNGGWIIARFSGTEPLLRIFCEMPNSSDAVRLCRLYEDFLGLI